MRKSVINKYYWIISFLLMIVFLALGILFKETNLLFVLFWSLSAFFSVLTIILSFLRIKMLFNILRAEKKKIRNDFRKSFFSVVRED